YIAYLSQFSQIDQNKALNESLVFEERIYNVFMENDEQKKVYEISRYIQLISKFSHLQMTRDYMVKYHEYRDKLKLKDMIAFLNEKSEQFNQPLLPEIDLSAVETNLDDFEDFYKLANEREQALVKNTIALMNGESKKVVVLIAGGFHTKGITEMLKSEDVSYIVVTPNMENDRKPIPYMSLLKNLRTPLEQMLATHTSTLKIASWLTKGAPLVYAERQNFLANKMKTLLTTTKLYDLYMNVLVKYSPEERMLIQGRLENQLKESIEKVLQIAGYQDVIKVEDISLTFDDISARMKLTGVDAPIYVRYTDRVQTDKVDTEIENSLLEMVRLNDGVTSEFMSSLGYLKATKSYRVLRTQVLELLYDKPMTTETIVQELSKLNPDTEITAVEVEALLASFKKLELISEDRKNFFVSRTEPSRFTAYLVMSLFSDKVKEGVLADTDFGVLKLENIDEKYQNIFNRLNIGTLIVEPMLPLETLKQLAEKLTSFGAEKELAPGDTIDLSDIAQINVISGTDKYILHVMSKPQLDITGEPAGMASPEIASVFNIAGQGVTPETAGQTSIGIQGKFIDALENLIGDYPVDITGSLFTQGEKAAILDYLYRSMDASPVNDPEVEYALHRYIGLSESVEPYYTKRVGSLIMGKSFDKQYDSSLLKLLALNPELEVNPDLEQAVASAVTTFDIDFKKGMSGYRQWMDLVSKVARQAPKSYRKNKLNAALANALEKIQAQEAQTGNSLTMDEISSIINESVLSIEFKLKDTAKPVLLSSARRKSFLDNAMADKEKIRFESQDNSVALQLDMVQKNADGTYTALSADTGDLYIVSLLASSTKEGEFKFKQLDSQSQAAFNDKAGFFIERINPADIPVGSKEARLKLYANLQSYWQEVIKNEGPAQIEDRIDAFEEYSQTHTIAQQLDKGNKYIQRRFEVLSEKLKKIKDQLRLIEMREISVQSLLQAQKNLQAGRQQLQNEATRLNDRLEFERKRQNEQVRNKMELLQVIVSKLILQQLFEKLDKVAEDSVAAGKDPVYETNQIVKIWFDIKPTERISEVLANKQELLKRLNLTKLFDKQDYQNFAVVLKELGNTSLVKSVVEQLFSRNINAVQHNIKGNIVDNIAQAIKVKRNLYHLQAQFRPDTERIERLKGLVHDITSASVSMAAWRKLDAESKDLNSQIAKLIQDVRKKRAQLTTGFTKKFAQLQMQIDTHIEKNKDDAKNKDKLNKSLIGVLQAREYLKFIDNALKTMHNAVAQGQKTIKINNKQFPLIPENFMVIAYGLAYEDIVVPFFKAEDKYRGSKDEKEKRIYQVLKGVTQRAYRNFYEKSKTAVMEAPVAFAELGDQSPADYLIYGTNADGNFAQFQNKTDNYRLDTLLKQSLALLSDIDPALADYITANFSIAVSGKPFLPATGKGLDNLISKSIENQTIYIGKAVFGKIARLIDLNPRLAVRLTAAALLASAQPVYNNSNLININTIDKPALVQVMADRLAAVNPEIMAIDEAKSQALALIEQTADTIMEMRKSQGQFISLDDLASLGHNPVFNLILPIIKVADETPKDAYKNAVKTANESLGVDYSNVLKLLKLERNLYMDALIADNMPAHLAADDVQSWTSVFRNKTLSTVDKYEVFFQRIFGTAFVFNQMKEIFSDFDPDASPEIMLENSRRLNEFLETFFNLDNYTVQSRRNKEGKMEYTLTFPNNNKINLTAAEMDKFQARINELKHSFSVYYHPQKGIGIIVKFPNKPAKSLPVFVQGAAAKPDVNLILEQARLRKSSEVVIDSVLQPELSALLDVSSAPAPAMQTVSNAQDFIQQRNIASKIKDTLKDISQQYPDEWIKLTHAERKALAALLLSQNQIGIEWVDYVTGLYNQNIPIVTSQKVRTVFADYINEDNRTNFIQAKHELLDLIAQDQWSELDPSVRKSVFEKIIKKYKLSVENSVKLRGSKILDEVSALKAYFAKNDRQAAKAEPSRLTGHALALLWENEKEKLSESTDAIHINAVFNQYLNDIKLVRQDILAQQNEDQAWRESVRNKLDMLKFFETRLQEGRFVNVFQAVEDFNDQYKGVVNINADRVYIAEHADQVLSLIKNLTTKQQIDETANPEDKMRADILIEYVKARKLWLNSEYSKAVGVLKNVSRLIKDNELYRSMEANTNIFSDISYMESLLEEPEKIKDEPLDVVFSGFDSVLKETLNRMPEQYYMQTLLSVTDYAYSGVSPESGVTDIIINLRDTVTDRKVAEEYNRTQFNEKGITGNGREIFINPSTFDFQSENAFYELSDQLKQADDRRMAQLDTAVRRLTDLGLPKDVRLLKFSASALQSIDGNVEKLENGFKAHDIAYSQDDFGKEVPVALHPAKYQEILDKEKEAFNTVRNLITEATRLVREDGDYDSAKVLLAQSQYIVANLQHLSKQVRASILNVITQDIQDIDAQSQVEAAPSKNEPAFLLSGTAVGNIISTNALNNDPLVKQLLKLGFEEIRRVNPDLLDEIKSNMTIVVGNRPRENVPLNTIYISPTRFELLKMMAKNSSTLSMAAVMFAGDIIGKRNKTRQFLSKIVTDYLWTQPDVYDRYIQQTQLYAGEITPDFSGDVITPLKTGFNEKGRFYADVNGPRTVTTFKNGRPVRVWDSVTGRQYALPLPFEQLENEAYRITRNESGEPVLVETLSPVEQWLGFLEPGEEIFFLSKGNNVVAVVKANAQTQQIVPIVDDHTLVSSLKVKTKEQAMNQLQKMVDFRRQRDKEKYYQEEIFPEGDMAPLEIKNSRGYRFRKMLLGGAVVVPLLLLALAGSACASHQTQIKHTTMDNPYNNTQLFKAPTVPVLGQNTGLHPQNLEQFIGTTGEKTTDMQAVAKVQEDTTNILQRSIANAKTQLQELIDRGSLDKTRVKQLRERVAMLEKSLSIFMEDVVGVPKISPVKAPTFEELVSEKTPVAEKDKITVHKPSKKPALIVVLDDVASDMRAMYSTSDMQAARSKLERFSSGLRINRGPYAGAVK
ncbi:hypothetical protein J7L67_02780, partial [bacterium]|nr:hypothetical protein [bacterium]